VPHAFQRVGKHSASPGQKLYVGDHWLDLAEVRLGEAKS
jgi:hypothetical protein